jgi:hypothetical protein
MTYLHNAIVNRSPLLHPILKNNPLLHAHARTVTTHTPFIARGRPARIKPRRATVEVVSSNNDENVKSEKLYLNAELRNDIDSLSEESGDASISSGQFSDSGTGTSQPEPEVFYATPTPPSATQQTQAATHSVPHIVVTPPSDPEPSFFVTSPEPGLLDGEYWDLIWFHHALAHAEGGANLARFAKRDFQLRMRVAQARSLGRQYALAGGVPDESPIQGSSRHQLANPTTTQSVKFSIPAAPVRQSRLILSRLTRLIEPIDATPRPRSPAPSAWRKREVNVPVIMVTPPAAPHNFSPWMLGEHAIKDDEDENIDRLDAIGFDFHYMWRQLHTPERALDLHEEAQRDMSLKRQVEQVYAIACRMEMYTPSYEESRCAWEEEQAQREEAATKALALTKSLRSVSRRSRRRPVVNSITHVPGVTFW